MKPRRRILVAGYTLLEMLVVVVVIGILAIWVLPKWVVPVKNDEDIIRSVNLYFRRIRTTAVARQAEVCFTTDLAQDVLSQAWVERGGVAQVYDAGIDEPVGAEIRVGSFKTAGGGTYVLQRGSSAGVEVTTGSQTSCVNHRGNQSGDRTTIHIGPSDKPSAGGNDGDQLFWYSWTFQDISGFYRYYPCGRHGDFPANDC